LQKVGSIMGVSRVLLLTAALCCATAAFAADKPGDTKGTVLEPSTENLARTWAKANLVLPAALAGGRRWEGHAEDAPDVIGIAPLVVVMHGSSGVAPAVKEFQVWLADELGAASVAPDSLAIPDRLTYISPVDVATYERVHALRLAELENALKAARDWSWVDRQRLVMAGTSEGAVAVGRYGGKDAAARLIYSWSCEDNYFVTAPRLGIGPKEPVLNAISARDPYFSAANPWNKDRAVTGSCAAALKDDPRAEVMVIDADVHTILNRPDVRDRSAQFLRGVLNP
jgi:dienelactone hydrolase